MFRTLLLLVAILAGGQAYAQEGPGTTPGTAAPRSILEGCVYNATPPSLSTGQQVAIQCDANGRELVSIGPRQLTLVPLDVATVTTGGTAVNALSAGHRTAGGWLYNPDNATAAMCVAEIGTASGTSSAGNTTCVGAGRPYTVAPGSGAVSVVTSDSAHPFSGMGFQ